MDVRDILGGGGHKERPNHPDCWRLSEIIMELKADIQELGDDPEAWQEKWRSRYEEILDFDSLEYHAIQCAMAIYEIETAGDLTRLAFQPERFRSFTAAIQAYFDGFIMGAEFERRGGHQEQS